MSEKGLCMRVGVGVVVVVFLACVLVRGTWLAIRPPG